MVCARGDSSSARTCRYRLCHRPHARHRRIALSGIMPRFVLGAPRGATRAAVVSYANSSDPRSIRRADFADGSDRALRGFPMSGYRVRARPQQGRPALDTRLLIVPLLIATAVAAAVALTLSAYLLNPLVMPLALLALIAVAVAVWRPVWGVALALLAVPLELASLPVGDGALSPGEGMLALVGLAWLARLALGRSSLPGREDLPFLVLLGVVAAGLAIAPDPAPVGRVLVLWSLFFVVHLAARSFSAAERRLVVGAFLTGAGILGALGAVQYLASGETGLMAGGEVTGERAVGTFADANYFAALLLLALLPGVGLILSDLRRFAWLMLPALGALGGVIFSLSRGGFLGLVAGLLVLLAWSRGRRAIAILVVAMAVAFALGQAPGADSGPLLVVAKRLSTLGGGPEVVRNRRPEIWRRAREIAVDNPALGVGVNQFSYEAAARSLFERGAPLENAHSLPLSLAAETGLVGLAAFLVFLFQLFVRGFRALDQAGEKGRGLALGLLGALVAFSVQALTVVPVRTPVIMGAFLVVAGLVGPRHDRVS